MRPKNVSLVEFICTMYLSHVGWTSCRRLEFLLLWACVQCVHDLNCSSAITSHCLWILSNVGYECSSIPRTLYSTGSSSFMQYSSNRSSHFSHGHVRKEWRGFQTSSFIYVPQTTAKPVRFSDLEPANGHVIQSQRRVLSVSFIYIGIFRQ